MKVDVTIKCVNDNASYSKTVECEKIYISQHAEELMDMIQKAKDEFGQECDEVILKTRCVM